MELVYLWVEDYKNIHKQGFNFSPRFRCEYDEEKNELEIIDKEETGEFYPKNFFGDNINITAIVGENGSGKTNLGKYISTRKDENDENFFILLHENNQFYSTKDNLKIENDIEIIDIQLIDIFDNLEECNLYGDCLSDFFKNFNERFFNLLKDNPNFFNFLNVEYIFDSYKFELNDEKFYDFSLKSNKLKSLNRFSSSYLNKLIAYDLLIGIFNNNIDDKIEEDILNLINKENFSIKELQILIKYCKKEKINLEIYTYLNTENLKFINEKFNLENNFITQEKEIVNNIDFENDLLSFLYYNLELIDINFLNKKKKNITFLDLSEGEKNQIYQLTKIAYFLKNETIKMNKIYFLDEPDLALHPNWQKRIINNIIRLNNQLEIKPTVHFIITSHSPFILSDLPKENVIFLEKGEQVYPFEDEKQTFGANIHTLLSHGFFMKGGLMGEFAKDKIQSIIKYHEDIEKKEVLEADKVEYKTKKQKEFWQIQSIIGDDYLKQVIKNHLVEIEKIVLGNDEAKKEEIKRLKAQIELLEK
ncbi:ATP-binding protein [Aliarcobacter butzleri]|uniref:ATP-binding protein n=1 Tax=Aliarcobacter butzleri TaxID=28197 RepID=UPI0021B17F13|nr:ATP-binding protein [Aliarcobacter butzleri]MCT7537179.1 ATP-binding protein [Aliarcobacter butzleri]MCT7578887.1 ATP-binding protein [Aliarcobacter butzleri]MCT7623757.1 ATP-binding protein [Aliarcobacter butzleri]